MNTLARLLLTLFLGASLALLALLSAHRQTILATSIVESSAPAQFVIRYVATTGSDTTDCTDSGNPCATIQYAVDQANPGDEIRVAGGEYNGVNNYGGLSQMVYISKTIIVRGGYTVTNWIDSDVNLYPTTLNAQGDGRVFYISGPVSSTVEGFQITGGNAFELDDSNGGGGIYVITASAKIVNNEIISNTAGAGGGILIWESNSWVYSNTILNNNGGGIALTLSASTVEGNTISENIGLSVGGGLLAASSQISIIANDFTNNQAVRGGAIYIDTNSHGTSIISNNISNNIAEDGGGGIYISQSNVTISDNIVASNTLSSTSITEQGGGIYISAETFTITQNTIAYNNNSSNFTGDGGGVYVGYNSSGLFQENLVLGNVAFQNGGGVYIESGGIISANHFMSNTSDEYGGGLYIMGTPSYIFGNHFEANSSHLGGGMFNSGSNTIENNVFTSNSAYIGGGLAASGGELILINNLIAKNEATFSGAGLLLFESISHLIHNTLAQNVGGNAGLTIGGGFPSASAYLTNTIIVSHTVGVYVGGSFFQDSASLEATLWDNETNIDGPGVITTGTINLYGTPSFVDPTNGDYHLALDSIAIDAGIDASVSTDMDGDSRPTGTGFDIGADEFTEQLSGSIRYVATTGSDTTDCTDSANPCATIQYAVDQANPGDETRVAGGDYTGLNNYGGLSQMVYISKTITIRGGYTLTNWIDADPNVNPTTLNAQGQGRVFYVTGPLSLTIASLQITGGLSDEDGGGLYGYQCSLTIQNSQFFDNEAGTDGGGIHLQDCPAVLEGNTFANNIAGQDGGGMNANYSELTLSNNIFEGNTAVNGGGMYLLHANTQADRNIISSNVATGWGGGIRLDVWSEMISANNLIVDNQAGQLGAGLLMDTNKAVHMIHNTIANNHGGDGAGIFNISSELWLTNTILVSHTVGIDTFDGTTVHAEATLWGNQTNWSGGGTVITGTINLYGVPNFADPDTGDYHLGPDSIAINTGINAGVTTDFDGDTRPSGAGFDLGADEFVGTAELEITKTASSQEILAGDALTYTLRVTNTGTLPLHARITDTLPGSITPTGVLTWTAMILPGQVWTQTVVVISSEVYSGTITNTVTVTTDEGVSGTATATVTSTVPIIPPPDIKLYLPIVRRTP